MRLRSRICWRKHAPDLFVARPAPIGHTRNINLPQILHLPHTEPELVCINLLNAPGEERGESLRSCLSCGAKIGGPSFDDPDAAYESCCILPVGAADVAPEAF